MSLTLELAFPCIDFAPLKGSRFLKKLPVKDKMTCSVILFSFLSPGIFGGSSSWIVTNVNNMNGSLCPLQFEENSHNSYFFNFISIILCLIIRLQMEKCDKH